MGPFSCHGIIIARSQPRNTLGQLSGGRCC
jgi:hypothetical protein